MITYLEFHALFVLPVEEALFFPVTTLFVVQAIVRYDRLFEPRHELLALERGVDRLGRRLDVG